MKDISVQALPMVTIVLGAKNNSDKCRLLSTNQNVTPPFKVEFPVPTEMNPLTVGEPAWANYVKGIVQYFDGNCVEKLQTRNYFISYLFNRAICFYTRTEDRIRRCNRLQCTVRRRPIE